MSDETPRGGMSRVDLVAIIGALANLSAGVMSGDVSQHMAEKIHKRLIRDLGEPGADLTEQLEGLIARLRWAIGERPDPSAEWP